MTLTGDDIPAITEMMNPTIKALRKLGGEASIYRIYDEVTQHLGLTEEQLAVLRYPGEGGRTIVEERLSWARTYLQKVGFLENPNRGMWALTAPGRATLPVNSSEVRRIVQEMENS